ncbi:MAG: hypothetical protein RR232_06125 [Clostridia bacterium]
MENKGQKVKVNLGSIAGVMRRTGKKERVHSDVQGSYTGMGIDDEAPVQDADDL